MTVSQAFVQERLLLPRLERLHALCLPVPGVEGHVLTPEAHGQGERLLKLLAGEAPALLPGCALFSSEEGALLLEWYCPQEAPEALDHLFTVEVTAEGWDLLHMTQGEGPGTTSSLTVTGTDLPALLRTLQEAWPQASTFTAKS